MPNYFFHTNQESKASLHQRQRNLLYLISQYLIDFGLKRSQAVLLEEANLSNEYSVCDNIDLDAIYLDYCSYYQLRFGKQPKVLKRRDVTSSEQQVGGKAKLVKGATKQRLTKSRSSSNAALDSDKTGESIPLADMISVSCIGIGRSNSTTDVGNTLLVDAGKRCRLREEFFGSLSADLKELAEVIERFVLELIFFENGKICIHFRV